MRHVAENIWLMPFPLSIAGVQAGRNVSLVRLTTGEVIIHSTAPFRDAEVAEIRRIGPPAALLEATLLHDTFARAARAALPGVPYFAPPALGDQTFDRWPASWNEELAVLPLAGMPLLQEHLVLHRPTRTLITGDFVFNMPRDVSWWTRLVFRIVSRMREYPAMSLAFRLAIRDRAAFRESMRRLLAWDFDRIIVGHGEPIETGGKEIVRVLLARHGLLPDD